MELSEERILPSTKTITELYDILMQPNHDRTAFKKPNWNLIFSSEAYKMDNRVEDLLPYNVHPTERKRLAMEESKNAIEAILSTVRRRPKIKSVGRVLAKGNHGEVYTATLTTGRECVVKKSLEAVDELRHEAAVGHLLDQLQCPNFMKTIGLLDNNDLALELIDGVRLQDIVLTKEERRSVILQVMAACASAYRVYSGFTNDERSRSGFTNDERSRSSTGFTHNDLHPQNILIVDEVRTIYYPVLDYTLHVTKVAKIVDYGSAFISTPYGNIGNHNRGIAGVYGSYPNPINDIYRTIGGMFLQIWDYGEREELDYYVDYLSLFISDRMRQYPMYHRYYPMILNGIRYEFVINDLSE